jgi:hypothetical protein
LELEGFGVQRVTCGGDAVDVGPVDVLGIDARDRRAPEFVIALIEGLDKVGVTQFSDRVGDDVPPDNLSWTRHDNLCA